VGVGWVAGVVRARLLARHRLGIDGALELAAAGSVVQAEAMLGASPYARGVAGATSVQDVQRAIWATVLWDIRILAGWLPPDGVDAARVFAGYFEIRNLEDLLALTSGERPAPLDLGGLATLHARPEGATSAHELREQLRHSAWRDPGTDDPGRMLLSLRLEWARRVADIDPATAAWGLGAAAIIVARSLVERERPLDAEALSRMPALNRRVAEATTLPALVATLPDSARWAIEAIDRPQDLWRAEAHWWQRIDRDANRMLRAVRPGIGVVIGAFAVRMADAWRTVAALDIANRGGRGREVLDAIP